MIILNYSTAELAAIKEVNKHLHDQVKELSTESNELSKQNKALVNHNFALRTENDGLCTEIKILHTELVDLKTEYDETKFRLNLICAGCERLTDENFELRAEIEKLKTV